MSIDKFISEELAYFLPMQKRSENATQEMKSAWRNETVSQRQRRISLEVYDLFEGRINYGPFAGLKLTKETWWGESDLGNQCLGLYEKEILNLLTDFDEDQFSAFIDIGAADGYYAIGMLKSAKVKKSICFEQSEKGRMAIQENWKRNGFPGSLEIFGEANLETIHRLQEADISNAFVLIDIEGYEFNLLQPEVLQKFKSCVLVIEIHNWVDDFFEKYKALLNEASQLFDISIVERVDRPISSLKELRDFTDDNRLLLTSERRPCLMRFLKLTPHENL